MPLKLALLGVSFSLWLGIQAADQHPLLPTWKCTTSSGCVQQNTSVVLDQGSTKYSKNPAGSRTIADYASMGVTTSGSALTLKHYVNGNAASPRVYLLDKTTNKYVMMSLLGGEFSVDADFSAVPCGENGALYLSEMEAGGRGNAATGTGYCDAQCQYATCF